MASKHYPKVNAGKAGRDHPSNNPAPALDMGGQPSPLPNQESPVAPASPAPNGNLLASLIQAGIGQK